MGFSIPASAQRVQVNTAPALNERIRRDIEGREAFFANHPELIPARLAELDREWDIERVIETQAATVTFAGVALAATVSRKWLILPALATGFLFQHAVQGWCPPIPVLRRLGFRTPNEIEDERHRLLMIQSSGSRMPPSHAAI